MPDETWSLAEIEERMQRTAFLSPEAREQYLALVAAVRAAKVEEQMHDELRHDPLGDAVAKWHGRYEEVKALRRRALARFTE